MRIKHLNDCRGAYAPQGNMGLTGEKRKMGKGIYIITAIVLSGLVYACTAMAEGNRVAMEACQVKHSFDTCYEKLRG